ncbi:hypothetical protein ES705_12539 [subsurface metagenome]|jgi:DNA-binding MarR family transcriptional regulator
MVYKYFAYTILLMKFEEADLTHFIKQVSIFHRIPIMSLCSKTARELDLNEEQIFALVLIAKTDGEILVSKIAELIFINTTKASRIIDSLVKVKLVHRVYAQLEDRRKIQLKLTEEGSKVTENFFSELFQSVKEFSDEVGSTVTKQLTENIQAFNDVMLRKMKSVDHIK